MDYCKKSVANDAKNAPACVVMGNIYAQQGDLKQAAQLYQTALKADPGQFEARENLKRIESLPMK